MNLILLLFYIAMLPILYSNASNIMKIDEAMCALAEGINLSQQGYSGWLCGSYNLPEKPYCPSGSWQGVTCASAGTVIRLDLSHLGVEGTLPESIGQLSGLTYFSAAGNQVSGTGGIWGLIPSTFGSLSKLQYFAISSNAMNGPIPSEFGNLTRLGHLDVSSNRMSGRVPSSLGDMASLSFLSLAGNPFFGTISDVLSDLHHLSDLYLQDTSISGTLPSALCQAPISIIHVNSLISCYPGCLGGGAIYNPFEFPIFICTPGS